MSVLLVIPARFASSRFPGKPLELLTGAGGEKKPLIQRSWEAACTVDGIDRIVVATDDVRIQDVAQGFGADVVMTSPDCRNGTERCEEAHALLGGGYEFVVNLQGDAPLTPNWFIEELVQGLRESRDAGMATPVLRCNGRAVSRFQADRHAGRVGGTTAVFDHESHALYFSKEVIPHVGEPFEDDAPTPVFHHVGVYAYRADALAAYATWPEGVFERLEGLEQLRFLENGHKIKCVPVESRGREFWELNNPSDVPRIERMLSQNGTD